MGDVPGSRRFKTALKSNGGEERAVLPLNNSEPFLEAMEISVQVHYHQQIVIYSPDEYLLSDSVEQHVL